MTGKIWALMAICMLPGVAAAETTSFGQWHVGLSDDKTTVFAGTMNDSGSLLAETCATDKDSCIWMLTIDSVCEEGAESKGDYRYRFNDWKSLESVILKAKKVGFAFPLQQDQFTVVRFSLNGVAKASQLAERLALEARKTKSEGTRNVTL